MNLINEDVTHKVFGKGCIIDHDEAFITINFDNEVKKFIYPEAFEKFITLMDKKTAKELEDVLLKKELEEEARLKEETEARERELAEQLRREKLKNNRIHESSQIVFWLDSDPATKQDVFANWQMSTGKVKTGKNKGQPNKVARVRPNSASLLTVRDKGQPETERKIIGIYMVNETFSGDQTEDGLVYPHEKFRIQLSEDEAAQLNFWDYYINKNHPKRTAWNSGKFRYYDNIWTAQILQDIKALKTDEEAKNRVQAFLEYFCEKNALDIEHIPSKQGALAQ